MAYLHNIYLGLGSEFELAFYHLQPWTLCLQSDGFTAHWPGGRAVPLPIRPLFGPLCTKTRPYAWRPGPSSWVVEAFAFHLRAHLDRQYVKYILQGLLVGFRLDLSHSSHRLRQRGHNHPFSLAKVNVVSDQVRAESQAARLFGPLPSAVARYIHVSPIDLVPKGHSTGR